MKTTETTTTEIPPEPKTIKQLAEELIEAGQFDYGSSMPRNILLDALGVSPLQEEDAADMSYKDLTDRWQKDALEELNAVNILRVMLLNKGKHLERKNDHYRVCFCSENKEIADRFQRSAQRKISKSRKLLAMTPPEFIGETNELASKLLIMEQSMKRNDVH